MGQIKITRLLRVGKRLYVKGLEADVSSQQLEGHFIPWCDPGHVASEEIVSVEESFLTVGQKNDAMGSVGRNPLDSAAVQLKTSCYLVFGLILTKNKNQFVLFHEIKSLARHLFQVAWVLHLLDLGMQIVIGLLHVLDLNTGLF